MGFTDKSGSLNYGLKFIVVILVRQKSVILYKKKLSADAPYKLIINFQWFWKCFSHSF